MNNHKDALDKKVYDSLQDMEAPYEPSNWAAMEARLDALYTEEIPPATDPIDTTVHQALSNMEVPFQPMHWDLMSKKLKVVQTLLRRIYTAKISEAAILILVFLNWGNLLVDQPTKPIMPPAQNPNIPVASSETNNTSENSIALSDATVSTPMASSALGHTSSTVTSMASEAHHKATTMSPLTLTQTSYVFPMGTTQQSLDEPSPVSVTAPDIHTISTQSDMLALDYLPSGAINMPNQDYNRSIRVLETKLKPHTRPYVAMYAALENNRIATPRDPIFRTPAYKTGVENVGAGVLIGKKVGKTLLESGFAYSSVRYEPKVNISGGRVGSALSQVDYDVVSIPVRVGRTLGTHKKLSIKAFAGVNLSTITQANYSYKNFVNTAPGPGVPPHAEATEIGNGFFEGGSFVNNSYLNIESSLRFEHIITKNNRWKAFIEPHYQHDLFNTDGTGPNRDRLSALSLRAGVLTTL